ncbi:MAG: class II aldolase/adducin family protein [Oscillospiraceae bacterium]|jgi:L-fuculose-phosphate aldolase|nr:class II aldolase/adducin family protein [Oscillospiraceae bacterium]
MTDHDAKSQILDIGRRLYELRLVAANDGNVSIRIGDAIWATPTNVSKGYMTDDMLVKLTLGGDVIAGTWKPSSEIKMHLAVYRANPAIGAVVHAHPPYATALAAAGLPLDGTVLDETRVLLGEIPLTKNAAPGTSELAEAVAAQCVAYRGTLMERHGVCTWAETAEQALFNMERIEFTAKIMFLKRGVD